MSETFAVIRIVCLVYLIYLRMKLETIDMTIFIGDGGHHWSGRAHRLEAVSNLLDAVTVGQQDLLLLS